MTTPFTTLRQYYENNQFTDLLHNPDGIYWLKLRSISRAAQLRQFCDYIEIDHEGIPARQLLQHLYNLQPSTRDLEGFIRQVYESERAQRRANEDYLVSQLYQMKIFDWGGLYQNSLEQTIVNNYVKRILGWNELNSAIENELHDSMKGYVQCSWYNHWSSILIEDIFKDHTAVLPATGLVKKVDFFVHNFPFDLKVTYFPDGYMTLLRRDAGLRPELTELKAFCRGAGIWFDVNTPASTLFAELLAKITEHPSRDAQNFIDEFKATRSRFVAETIRDPRNLIVWLYENQGVRRFDASNRFFLILVDIKQMEESWKLKRNKALLAEGINRHLSGMRLENIDNLRYEFRWQDSIYETFADILFIVVE